MLSQPKNFSFDSIFTKMVLHRLIASSTFRVSCNSAIYPAQPGRRVHTLFGSTNVACLRNRVDQFSARIYHAIPNAHRAPSATLFVRLQRSFFTGTRLLKRRPISNGNGRRYAATITVPPTPQASPGFLNTIVVVTEAGANLTAAQRKTLGTWLMICGLTAAMTITVGGLTRLTEAGLSITKWDLVKGILPPLDPMSWRMAFERYKQYPEFQYKNSEMTMEEFKDIYWMEYGHRMMGRLIGVLFFVPAAYFWYKGRFDRPLGRQVMFAGALLLWQGVLGWLMVRSGLVNHRHDDPNHVPRVSQYRLAAHLGSALALTVTFMYMGQNLLKPALMTRSSVKILKPQYLTKFAQAFRAVHACAGLAFLTAVSGAFVAGLDAGLVYNSFPKFAGQWIPSDLISDRMPFWRNVFENPTTCQFDHRLLGTLTGVAILATWMRYSRFMVSTPAKRLMLVAAAATVGQASLGIATLIKNVPISWAALHQTNNTVLLILLTLVIRELRWLRRAIRL